MGSRQGKTKTHLAVVGQIVRQLIEGSTLDFLGLEVAEGIRKIKDGAALLDLQCRKWERRRQIIRVIGKGRSGGWSCRYSSPSLGRAVADPWGWCLSRAAAYGVPAFVWSGSGMSFGCSRARHGKKNGG